MPQAAGLWYEEHGPADGPPLILSAGLGGSGSYWQPNLTALAAHHRVIVYDHRGTGRSDRTLPETISVATMAKDVLGLLDALGISEASFVGHALGGMIGMAIAVDHGDRIAKLVIVNGWLRLDPHTARCFDVRLDILRNSGPRAFLKAQPLFLYPPDWISAHDTQLVADVEAQLVHLPEAAAIEKRIAAVRAFEMEWRDVIATKLLVIATQDDMLVPFAASKDVAAAAPWAELAIMPWGGHACNVTDPDRFNSIVLNFLGS